MKIFIFFALHLMSETNGGRLDLMQEILNIQNILLVFDDMQLEIKGNQLVETLFIRGWSNKTGIIQCEQFTQATAHIQKANTDFFVLIPPFNESTAQ